LASERRTIIAQRLAADCLFLRRTMDLSRREEPLVTLCTHPVRDGFECVGPFMDDMPTPCGLWEPGPPPLRPPAT